MSMKIKHHDRTITLHGLAFSLVETRDGVQRGLYIKQGDTYIGAVWTGKWSPTVYAKADSINATTLKKDATERLSKNRLFTEFRNRLISDWVMEHGDDASLAHALEWTTAYVELSTGNGCVKNPSDWPRLANEDPDPEAIAKRGRLALAAHQSARSGWLNAAAARGADHDRKVYALSRAWERLGAIPNKTAEDEAALRFIWDALDGGPTAD